MAFKPELIDIYKNINDMVRFAETKNSGFIALNVGMIVTIFVNYYKLTEYIFPLGLIAAACMFCLAIITSISSLFPTTKNKIADKNILENPNLYFFGDLAQMDLELFTQFMREDDPEFTPSKMQEDLINQILINSRIALGKFKMFKFSVTFTVIGISIVAVSFLGKGAIKMIMSV